MKTFDAPDGTWWYMRLDEKHGPVGTERLLQMLHAGEISEDTWVWRDERSPMASTWLPLRLALKPRVTR